MPALPVFSLDAGTSTRWCLAAAALRTRVRKSAIGSVCIVWSLPARFHDAGNFPAQGHAAEADAAQLEFAHVAARTAAETAAVAHAHLELGFFPRLCDLGRTRHAIPSSRHPCPRKGTPSNLSSSRPSSSFFAVVVSVMFIPLILSTRV